MMQNPVDDSLVVFIGIIDYNSSYLYRLLRN